MDDEFPMSRRVALGVLAAGAIGYAALGPRGAGRRADGRLVLDYWEKWTGDEARAMQRVVDAYNASQSRVFVRYFTMASIDQKAQVAIAAGEPPDVLGLYAYNIPAFSEASAIVPLDAFGTSTGVTPVIYGEGVRPLLTRGGRLWGACAACGSLALYYNRAHFREVGLDPDRPPSTIEEFDAIHDRFTRRDATAIERVGMHPREPGWWNYVWGFHFGGGVCDPSARTSIAASAANLRAYEWIQRWPRSLGLPELNLLQSKFGSYASALNAFFAGRVSMILQGPWLANVIAAYAPTLDYGVAPFPVVRDLHDPEAPLGLVEADILAIPRGCKHPEAAMEFIAFTQRQENQELVASLHAKASPLRTSSDAFRQAHTNRGVRVFERIQSSPRAFAAPSTRAWGPLRDRFNGVMDDVWNLRATPKEALAAAQRDSQRALDLVDAQRRRRAQEAPA